MTTARTVHLDGIHLLQAPCFLRTAACRFLRVSVSPCVCVCVSVCVCVIVRELVGTCVVVSCSASKPYTIKPKQVVFVHDRGFV